MLEWEVLVVLLCWELMWGCWRQSLVATPMQSLHEHIGLYFDESRLGFDDVLL